MIRKQHIVKVNAPGGVLPAGVLLAIAEAAGAGSLSVGSRQQVYLDVRHDKLEEVSAGLAAAGVFFEVDADEFPNIVSAYVADDILPDSGWTRQSVYKDILDGFDTPPRLKVNLVDPGQNLVPFTTGHLNFVASPMGNYWRLLVRRPGSAALSEWPSLVYSGHIGRLCRLLEGFHTDDLDDAYRRIMASEQWTAQEVTDRPALPEFALPYYEGFSRYAQGLWLGIYRRDERYPASFIREACQLALRTRVAQFFTTPWKSIVIKGIVPGDRKGWDWLLGKYLINVRHALNELCWQTEDLCEEGLQLRNYLVRQFDREDVRTWGLCFGVQVRGERVFGSVLVRKQPNTSANQRKALDRYDILYARDFNPHAGEYVLFRKAVEKEHLAPYLMSLCKYYYERGADDVPHHAFGERAAAPAAPGEQVLQCRRCLTIGEPGEWCPVCDSDDFALVPKPLPAG
ncbi:MAG TPA: hypothetical protein VL547_17310 [Dinghuibacter sp.]|uniref:rubredoxin n=1 Tax=Dinghuibacter sp. TaxID=2024697 RepID=UPI002CD2F4FF|nr:rubredoxin [Dinghuibacter sp.]HTJ13800.1 hypothetical protein [Dinghuibacter sp.]